METNTRPVDEQFEQNQIPLVYSTNGVVIDFAKHQFAIQDADRTADAIGSLFVYDSPLTILERTLTVTGAAQTLVMPAFVLGDANVADQTRIVCVDLGIQLNNQTLPKTDINFELLFRDATGATLASRTQTITGNASVTSGDTRQYVRMVCFEQNATMNNAGVTSPQDGKIISLPRFQRPDSVQLAAVLASLGLTPAQARTVFPSLSQDVAEVVINIPAGGFAAGVVLTGTVITVGRMPVIGEMMSSLDAVASFTDSTAADNNNNTFMSRLFGRREAN